MNPLVFEPYFRPQIWGGRRLARYFGSALPSEGQFGEAWLLSAHPLHASRVAEGPLKGRLLTDLWLENAVELAGRPAGPHEDFPLLLKLLDCEKLLSVQVHPNDHIVQRLLPGELGKTEAWVVLDADSTARIYAGLQPGVTRRDLERHLDAGTVDHCLASFAPQPGQCVFLPAGVVHAAGGGLLMAEVQQSSDATFRLFDWNRLGPDGKPRTLHRDESLESIDWSAGPVMPATGAPMSGLPTCVRGERLVDCPQFKMDRFHLDGSFALPYPGQMSLWIVLDGEAEISGNDYTRRFRPGETLLASASTGPLTWTRAGSETATLLSATAGERN